MLPSRGRPAPHEPGVQAGGIDDGVAQKGLAASP
jgi:hypothetical protein